MADISEYLEAIQEAIYGEEVRGSIINAIALINNVGIKQLTIGTEVTSASSSIKGYYQDSVYVNKNTWDVWKCTGTAWALQGNIKGAKGDTGMTPNITMSATADAQSSASPTVVVSKGGTTAAPTFALAFSGLKGAKGDTGATPNISASASVDANVGTPEVTVTKGGTTAAPTLTFTFKNLKGQKGDQGNPGSSSIDDSTIASNKLWSSQKTKNYADGLINDLGLSVVNGKVCQTYNA